MSRSGEATLRIRMPEPRAQIRDPEVTLCVTHPSFDGDYGEVGLHPLETARLLSRLLQAAAVQLSPSQKAEVLEEAGRVLAPPAPPPSEKEKELPPTAAKAIVDDLGFAIEQYDRVCSPAGPASGSATDPTAPDPSRKDEPS